MDWQFLYRSGCTLIVCIYACRSFLDHRYGNVGCISKCHTFHVGQCCRSTLTCTYVGETIFDLRLFGSLSFNIIILCSGYLHTVEYWSFLHMYQVASIAHYPGLSPWPVHYYMYKCPFTYYLDRPQWCSRRIITAQVHWECVLVYL